MRVLLLAVLLSATSQSENQAESRSGNICLHRQGAATVRLVSGDTAHRCWWTVPGKVLFRRLGIRVDKRAGADALRRGWIGLTMKPLIGYGSDVSAPRPARLIGDKTSTWTYSQSG